MLRVVDVDAAVGGCDDGRRGRRRPATEGIAAASRRWWDRGVTLVLDGIAEGQGLAMAIRSDLPLAAPYGHSGCGSRSSHLQDGGTQRYFAIL